jgi:hypothetical protein
MLLAADPSSTADGRVRKPTSCDSSHSISTK